MVISVDHDPDYDLLCDIQHVYSHILPLLAMTLYFQFTFSYA